MSTTCRRCTRPMRGLRGHIAAVPGTVRTDGRGLCQPCHHAATQDGSIDDYPLAYYRSADLLDEAAFLLSMRGAEGTCAALGITPGAIARAAQRAGQHEFARIFDRLERKTRAERKAVA